MNSMLREPALDAPGTGFWRAMARGTSRTPEKRIPPRESPAIQVRFSRFRGTIQQGPVQRQETQIVQSCNTLDDFLPGFLPRVL